MVVILTLALIAAVTVGYVSYETGPGESGEDQNSYIFLEIWCHKDGKNIIGDNENIVMGYTFIDFATYDFDEETGGAEYWYYRTAG